jgi:hypothetical protein
MSLPGEIGDQQQNRRKEIINSSYAREEKLDKIVTIDDYNSINKKLSGCTRL